MPGRIKIIPKGKAVIAPPFEISIGAAKIPPLSGQVSISSILSSDVELKPSLSGTLELIAGFSGEIEIIE